MSKQVRAFCTKSNWTFILWSSYRIIQLFAKKKNNGVFFLRIEDTDQNRFVPGAEEYIMEALRMVRNCAR
jgi:hypothetical protein